MSTEDLRELERIVQQDISEWPAYAQVLYLHQQRIATTVDAIHTTIEGDNGLKDQVKDHDRRLKSLEAAAKWAAGIGAGIVLMVATAIAQGKRLI